MSLSTYYLGAYRKAGRDFVTKLAVVSGPDAGKFVGLYRKLREGGRVIHCEGNLLFYEHPAVDAFNSRFYEPYFVFLGPIVVKQGSQFWRVGSWSKRNLEKLCRKLRAVKGATVELLSLKECFPQPFLGGVLASLTPKQRQALYASAADGYFDSPRGKTLEQVAAGLGVDESSLRERLRKAEGAVIKAALEELP